ncbi:DUF4912 domain-containing protein [Heliorestis acidaminivorans]|uniref:DUF4912 domain-containing protein n=1 Tax=Heliorestis acidaminivorans TaxID=553427 RepID=UPI001478C97C|nr:DUF4912 domain-containing protein [Heliorestis acidaminivorans]
MLSTFTLALLFFFAVLIAATAFFTFSWYQKEARRPPVSVRKTNYAEEFANDLTPLVKPKRFDQELAPLPHRYEQNAIALLARSPYSLYAYWEVSAHMEDICKSDCDQQAWSDSPYVLRFYNITATSNLEEAPYEDFYISNHDDHWYFNNLQPAHKYCFAIGRLLPHRFVPLLVSNEATTPADSPSTIIDPDWPPLFELTYEYNSINRKDMGESPITGWGITSPNGAWSISKREVEKNP